MMTHQQNKLQYDARRDMLAKLPLPYSITINLQNARIDAYVMQSMLEKLDTAINFCLLNNKMNRKKNRQLRCFLFHRLERDSLLRSSALHTHALLYVPKYHLRTHAMRQLFEMKIKSVVYEVFPETMRANLQYARKLNAIKIEKLDSTKHAQNLFSYANKHNYDCDSFYITHSASCYAHAYSARDYRAMTKDINMIDTAQRMK